MLPIYKAISCSQRDALSRKFLPKTFDKIPFFSLLETVTGAQGNFRPELFASERRLVSVFGRSSPAHPITRMAAASPRQFQLQNHRENHSWGGAGLPDDLVDANRGHP